MKRFTKLFNTKAASVDEDAKTIRFKISDNKPDRMGEIVDQETWDFKSYLTNPILLWGHNPDEPENVLGSTLSLDVEGDSTYATVKLDEDINPKAGLVWKQLLRGTLRTVSVGFINKKFEFDTEDEDATPVLKDNELLEISIVPIPANPRAIALSLKEGSISRKDAEWLVAGMRKEAELVESQLKESNKQEKKSMTEEQAQALIDGLAKTNEKLDSLAEENKTLREEVAALKPADPDPEPEPTPDPAPEPEPTPTPAKGGNPDQPGAGEDDFDPDAEVTPEQQAEIDAAIEAELEAANA